jgi:hypothetical protein
MSPALRAMTEYGYLKMKENSSIKAPAMWILSLAMPGAYPSRGMNSFGGYASISP